jgi:antitoxin HicB
MKYEYPATIKHVKARGYVVQFPDLPQLSIRVGAPQQAWPEAQAALSSALALCVKKKIPFPSPSPIMKKHIRVPVSLLVAAKLALHQAMMRHNITNVALAGRLGVSEAIVRRLLNIKHSSKIERVQAALTTLNEPVVLEDCGSTKR